MEPIFVHCIKIVYVIQMQEIVCVQIFKVVFIGIIQMRKSDVDVVNAKYVGFFKFFFVFALNVDADFMHRQVFCQHIQRFFDVVGIILVVDFEDNAHFGQRAFHVEFARCGTAHTFFLHDNHLVVDFGFVDDVAVASAFFCDVQAFVRQREQIFIRACIFWRAGNTD